MNNWLVLKSLLIPEEHYSKTLSNEEEEEKESFEKILINFFQYPSWFIESRLFIRAESIVFILEYAIDEKSILILYLDSNEYFFIQGSYEALKEKMLEFLPNTYIEFNILIENVIDKSEDLEMVRLNNCKFLCSVDDINSIQQTYLDYANERYNVYLVSLTNGVNYLAKMTFKSISSSLSKIEKLFNLVSNNKSND